MNNAAPSPVDAAQLERDIKALRDDEKISLGYYASFDLVAACADQLLSELKEVEKHQSPRGKKIAAEIATLVNAAHERIRDLVDLTDTELRRGAAYTESVDMPGYANDLLRAMGGVKR